MQIRITVTEEPSGTAIRIDGWLDGGGVAELARALNAATPPVRLLVHDLRGADAAGLSLLSGLANQGTPLEGLSTYIQLMLASHSAGPTAPASSAPTRSETPVRRKAK